MLVCELQFSVPLPEHTKSDAVLVPLLLEDCSNTLSTANHTLLSYAFAAIVTLAGTSVIKYVVPQTLSRCVCPLHWTPSHRALLLLV